MFNLTDQLKKDLEQMQILETYNIPDNTIQIKPDSDNLVSHEKLAIKVAWICGKLDLKFHILGCGSYVWRGTCFYVEFVSKEDAATFMLAWDTSDENQYRLVGSDPYLIRQPLIGGDSDVDTKTFKKNTNLPENSVINKLHDFFKGPWQS